MRLAKVSFLLAVLWSCLIVSRLVYLPTDNAATADTRSVQRRKFVSYVSSQWEKMWISRIEEWTKEQRICEIILEEQASFTREYLENTCAFFDKETNLCMLGDTVETIWLDLSDFTCVGSDVPESVEKSFKEQLFQSQRFPPVVPKHVEYDTDGTPRIFSKFVFEDQLTGEKYEEFIEPLVSHLRHPLSECIEKCHALTSTRSYIIPPPGPLRGNPNTFYFDAGASSWHLGGGGPSLSFFTSAWLRNNIDFDYIKAYEAQGTVENFYSTLPAFIPSNISYENVYVSGNAQENDPSNPFIPHVINDNCEDQDYVFFKLDIDNFEVEENIVNYLLSLDGLKGSKHLSTLIDEFAFEHHIDGNYLMGEIWGIPPYMFNTTLEDSYNLFLQFRNMGVRAHSYV